MQPRDWRSRQLCFCAAAGELLPTRTQGQHKTVGTRDFIRQRQMMRLCHSTCVLGCTCALTCCSSLLTACACAWLALRPARRPCERSLVTWLQCHEMRLLARLGTVRTCKAPRRQLHCVIRTAQLPEAVALLRSGARAQTTALTRASRRVLPRNVVHRFEASSLKGNVR